MGILISKRKLGGNENVRVFHAVSKINSNNTCVFYGWYVEISHRQTRGR